MGGESGTFSSHMIDRFLNCGDLGKLKRSNSQRPLPAPLHSTIVFTPGEVVLRSNSLMGMCHWIGLHFRIWIDYDRVSFSLEFSEWDHTFLGFGG